MAFLDLNSHPPQLGHHITAGALAVVGQEKKRNLPVEKRRDESLGSGHQLRTTIDHSIHVNQKS
jgi:hypothetical protein